MKALALFDFDGTITTRDTLVAFIQFAVGKPSYYKGLLAVSFWITACVCKSIPPHVSKQKLISHFFAGWDATRFKKLGTCFALEHIDTYIRPEALKKIRWHQHRGDQVVIVSASMECWLKAWCDTYHIDLIATRLEIQNNKLTGKFATRNCSGIEKVNRVNAAYDLSQYERIYAYGDSRGDRELLASADESFYKPFRK